MQRSVERLCCQLSGDLRQMKKRIAVDLIRQTTYTLENKYLFSWREEGRRRKFVRFETFWGLICQMLAYLNVRQIDDIISSQYVIAMFWLLVDWWSLIRSFVHSFQVRSENSTEYEICKSSLLQSAVFNPQKLNLLKGIVCDACSLFYHKHNRT